MGQNKIIYKIIATGFGCGYSPFAPGTVGALAATGIWLLLAFFLDPTTLLFATLGLILVFTFLGIWASNKLESDWGEDPSRVVVDEMVGVWIPLLVAKIEEPYTIVLAFILFRFFDILKPLGIRKLENLKGGFGVMLDDVGAGIYSLILLLSIIWVKDYIM